jgi:hypothetical protein
MKHTCPSGKRVYLHEALAIDALIEANVQLPVGQNRGPVTIYRCDLCGCYHLTSQGQIHPQLETLISEGTLAKMKRAAEWEKKLKKR